MTTRLKCLRPPLVTTSPGGWRPDAERGSRHERGYGWEWEKKREVIKARAQGLCEPHLEQGIVHLGTECDHTVPKAQGGTDDESNLRWVCAEFHAAKTARESQGGGG